MTMKKIYNSPKVEVLDITIVNILALSLEEETANLRGHSSDQKSDEFRGDWSNIWENM